MRLVHEIWEEAEGLTTGCLAGPDGDGARASLGEGARLVRVFEAGSHFEAMSLYNAALGREPYSSTEPWDLEPYPAEWFARQQASAPEWRALHARLLAPGPG
jgi:hypothetical protein